MQFAVTGHPAAPMPSRISAWASTTCLPSQRRADFSRSRFWHAMGDLCSAFGFDDLKNDARSTSTTIRVRARDWLRRAP